MLIGERYRLLRLVGRGGMGRVWLARDEVLHRDVAIKEVALPDWLEDEEQDRLTARTLREARITARLSHPNVVSVHDVVTVDATPWIIMEYVPSRSLQEVLGSGPVSPRRAAEIGLAVLAALTAAHRAGVVHRDVKPGNVLIADDGRVMLTDFGLATFDDGRDGVTRSGMIMGSPEYVAPERAAEGASTPATDLWSLGATLHAAVEGRSPYARSTAMATLTALATAPPDPAPHAGPLTPVLAGLLRRDPASRLTGGDVERLLQGVLDSTPVDEPTVADWSGVGARLAAIVRTEVRPGPEWGELKAPAEPIDRASRTRTEWLRPPGPEPAEPGSRRRWLISAVATAVAVVLAVVGTVFLVKRDNDDVPDMPASAGLATRQPGDTPGGSGRPGPRRGGPDGDPGPPPPPPPFACVRPVPGAGREITATPAPKGETLPLPKSWTWYVDPSGFRVAVPTGWLYFDDEGVACFQDPVSNRSLSVDPSTPAKLAAQDPVGLLRDEERRAVDGGLLPKYQKVSLGRRAGLAEWDLKWTAPYGERLRALRIVTKVSGGHAYTLGWLAPDEEWDADAAGLATVRASFRPAS